MRCLSLTFLSQVKMEAEIQEAKELIRPLLEKEQDLETFLKTQDEGKMMKREIKMRQNLFQQFLNHGNAKGYVFLDICDLDAYNPYLHHGKKPHNCKVSCTCIAFVYSRRGRLAVKQVARFSTQQSHVTWLYINTQWTIFYLNVYVHLGCQYKWITPSRDQDGDYATPAIDLFTEQSPDNSTTDNTRSRYY
uniref:Uncharacterized protein n=1 Tax=Hippocampus comes TaxID=109280 RepID=A0A3Q2YVT9_HIPCM